MRNLFFGLLAMVLCVSCGTKTITGVNPDNFNAIVDGKQVKLYSLTNENGMLLQVTNFGARVVTLFAPDRDGNLEDVVLGYENIDRYVNNKGERFLGATIGRVGNRIANGKFTLNGTEYTLSTFNNGQCLHGGDKGFDMVVWDVDSVSDNAIYFSYLSPDGEEGFPGNLDVKMVYTLTANNEFKIEHYATTDAPTPVNLTHHSFFNLNGEGDEPITNHILKINAGYITPVNEVLIPTGELQAVAGTPFDFTSGKAIGQDIEADDNQLKMGLGYDHNFVLNRVTENDIELVASVYEPNSGRVMEVWTGEPALQFYSGNFFNGKTIGKSGKSYDFRGAIALESQHYPDSPNHAHFPNIILQPNEEYKHTCIYKFAVK